MRIRTQLTAILALSLYLSVPLAALAITGFENDPVNPPNNQTPTEDPVTETPPEEEVTDGDPVTEEPEGEEPTVVIIQNRDGPPEEQDFTKKTPDTKQPVQVTKPYVPDVKVFPVPSRANFCPQGLQPVTISGTISCGRPTERVTYQQMMQHPQAKVVKKRTYHRSAVPDCTPGLKGCVDR